MWVLLRNILIVGILGTFFLSGFPSDKFVYYATQDIFYGNLIQKDFAQLFKPEVKKIQAANFSMQTGYYIGSGSTLSISGLGFQPDFILIKSDTNAGEAVFKTSAMASTNMALIGPAADNTTSQITIDSDGFTVGNIAYVNRINDRYNWVAFGGSDCSSSGTFCVGQYTGNGSSPRKISTGFQPDFVLAKHSTANFSAHFHTASQPDNEIGYLTNSVRNTSGNYIRDFVSDGFNVGHSGSSGNNVNGQTYNYIAFKATSGIFSEGSYTGNNTDNRNITGVGFKPDFVLVKSISASPGTINISETYGDYGILLTAVASSTNNIQELQSDGFQVGTATTVNANADTYYWVAFGGSADYTSSGTFRMDVGSYTGTGTSQSITGLGFAPDLVIIKAHNGNYSVFRTSMMRNDLTNYLAVSAGDFTQGITSLDSDGFTVGLSSIVNTNGITYEWQAFGNAYNPYTNTGASDFAIGAYIGNGVDNRNIVKLPWQPDFIATKRNTTSPLVWRSSVMGGDVSSSLNATADSSNKIQAFNSDGFQVGSDDTANFSGSLYRWFAFKQGSSFAVGGYTGNSTDNRDITDVGFQPDLVFVKGTAGVNGVFRSSSLTGDSSQYFINLPNTSDRIQSLLSNGFQLGGNQTETNTNASIYRYIAWKIPSSAPEVSVTITTDGTINYGTINSGETISTLNLSDTQTVQNDGGVPIDINIKTSTPEGWTLGSVSGTDTFIHEFSTNAGSDWIEFIAEDTYQSFWSNLGVDDTKNFDLRFTSPNPSTVATEKIISVTIQAVEH